MARGVAMSSLLDDLRADLAQVTQVNLSILDKPVLVRALKRAQNALVTAPGVVWPHLKARRYKSLSAGQRYYDFPTDMPYEQVSAVRRLWSGVWSPPLIRGITMDQYNAYDSDNDVRSDPVQRWDVHDVSGAAQVEFWPLPDTNVTDGIMFVGQRNLKAFNSDADVCDLDSEVLLMYAAGTYLENVDPARANAKKSQAKRLANSLVANAGKSRNKGSFADSSAGQTQRPEQRFVVVR